ncbi:MAG: hypothetical protein BGP16_05500 [Sphingobium sp. 66-54]|nr:MAG: hypothetical protein BGP16_05500 [Sphingobium sp. 66-54]
MTSSSIADALETASHDLDTLIQDIRLDRREARSIEDVEERVQAIAGRMLVTVRGPAAAAHLVQA